MNILNLNREQLLSIRGGIAQEIARQNLNINRDTNNNNVKLYWEVRKKKKK